MSDSLVFFPIFFTFGIVTLLCGHSIVVAIVPWEAWAIAAVITMLVTLATVGAVV